MTDPSLQQLGEQTLPAATAAEANPADANPATTATAATEATPAATPALTPATPTTQATSGKGKQSGKGDSTAASTAKGQAVPLQGKGKGGLRECHLLATTCSIKNKNGIQLISEKDSFIMNYI